MMSRPQRLPRGGPSLLLALTLAVMLGLEAWSANPAPPSATATNATALGPVPTSITSVVAVRGVVEVARAGSVTWDPARPEQALFSGDQLRTGERSRATVRLPDGSVVHYDELTQVRFGATGSRGILELLRGLLSFFHRDEPGSVEVRSGGVTAVIRGTEFVFGVAPDGTVDLALTDGAVEFANAQGTIVLNNLERGIARPGEAPRRTALLASEAIDSIQWLLYYPAILDPDDLPLAGALAGELVEVLRWYREGDLLRAMAAYPRDRVPVDPAERVLLAALVLSVGNVAEAQRWLETGLSEASVDLRVSRAARALRRLIQVAKVRPPSSVASESTETESRDPLTEATTATETLAASYEFQARRDLSAALVAARRAAELRPNFGHAWARVAELEFSFGHLSSAKAALARAIELSPRHAQALTVQGFIDAAAYHSSAARARFEQAIHLDPGLGNAWLGRGLVRWRAGDTAGGLADLTLAVATEPERGFLRSYLAKAYTDRGDFARAAHELELARERDPLDPTVWLYTALLHQQGNHINEALRDLTRAEQLNHQRATYRSALLLDQDRAVIGAQRAQSFRDAGLEAQAVREAGRALPFDAANPAAHLFLAESYANAERINLRLEAARVSEYLQASLLAPVGAGPLSVQLSQQEYSRLFEQDALHGFSLTRYRSSGGWEQAGGLFGTQGRLGYLADGYYARGEGVASNTDFEQVAFETQTKVQATARDTFYLQALGASLDAGDLATYATPTERDPDRRVHEELRPILLLGWHRVWSPEHHSLVLGGWLEGTQELDDPNHRGLLYVADDSGAVASLYETPPATLRYASQMEWLTLEAQHLWQTESQTAAMGVRYASGRISAQQTSLGLANFGFPEGPSVDRGIDRAQLYAYETWRLTDTLSLTAGISADWMSYPDNFRAGPLAETASRVAAVSPKAGVVWRPFTNLWWRAGFSRSLGGVGFEQSFRLEPTQLGGFNQAYRSLISESVAGALSGERIQTGNLALEGRLTPDTFVGLEGEWLDSSATRREGFFAIGPGFGQAGTLFGATQLGQKLDQTERALSVYAHRVLDRDWAVSLRYRVGWLEFDEAWPDLPTSAANFAPGFRPRGETDFLTHTVSLGTRYNHPTGWFAGAEASWTFQSSEGARAVPSDGSCRVDVFAGRRFWQRRAVAQVGLENLTDEDYRLSPLTLITTPPRERTLVFQLKLAF